MALRNKTSSHTTNQQKLDWMKENAANLNFRDPIGVTQALKAAGFYSKKSSTRDLETTVRQLIRHVLENIDLV